MKTTPEQRVQMERYMMKLLICIMLVSAATVAVPLYMLHEADMRASLSPAARPGQETVVR